MDATATLNNAAGSHSPCIVNRINKKLIIEIPMLSIIVPACLCFFSHLRNCFHSEMLYIQLARTMVEVNGVFFFETSDGCKEENLFSFREPAYITIVTSSVRKPQKINKPPT